jgi:hypothetical protein
MILLRVMELIALAFFIYGMFTQVIIPLFNDTALFPFLRKQRKLEEEITDLHQLKLEKTLEQQVEEGRKELTKNKRRK